MFKFRFLLFIGLWGILLPIYSQIESTVLSPPDSITLPDTTDVKYYYLDIDDNDTTDFYLEVIRFTTSENTPRDVESYSCNVYSLDNNRINSGPYELNDTISSSIQYHETDLLYGWIPEYGGSVGSWSYHLSSPDDVAYIGLKLVKPTGTYYGWLKLKANYNCFTVYSYALNETLGQMIKAGQTH